MDSSNDNNKETMDGTSSSPQPPSEKQKLLSTLSVTRVVEKSEVTLEKLGLEKRLKNKYNWYFHSVKDGQQLQANVTVSDVSWHVVLTLNERFHTLNVILRPSSYQKMANVDLNAIIMMLHNNFDLVYGRYGRDMRDGEIRVDARHVYGQILLNENGSKSDYILLEPIGALAKFVYFVLGAASVSFSKVIKVAYPRSSRESFEKKKGKHSVSISGSDILGAMLRRGGGDPPGGMGGNPPGDLMSILRALNDD
jgi:hypothetical protein